METSIKIQEASQVKDYFPCVFTNKDKSIIIFADARTSEKTFSGMVIHITGDKGKTSTLGTYSTGWTYIQFQRLTKNSVLTLNIKQDD